MKLKKHYFFFLIQLWILNWNYHQQNQQEPPLCCSVVDNVQIAFKLSQYFFLHFEFNYLAILRKDDISHFFNFLADLFIKITNISVTAYLLRGINSPIPPIDFLAKYIFIHFLVWIEIIQPFLNLEGASKCISQHR